MHTCMDVCLCISLNRSCLKCGKISTFMKVFKLIWWKKFWILSSHSGSTSKFLKVWDMQASFVFTMDWWLKSFHDEATSQPPEVTIEAETIEAEHTYLPHVHTHILRMHFWVYVMHACSYKATCYFLSSIYRYVFDKAKQFYRYNSIYALHRVKFWSDAV